MKCLMLFTKSKCLSGVAKFRNSELYKWQKHLEEKLQKYLKVSVSHRTVSGKICDMNRQLESHIRKEMGKCESFSS
jgi:hypothetical protein